jgi:hypothetical protein
MQGLPGLSAGTERPCRGRVYNPGPADRSPAARQARPAGRPPSHDRRRARRRGHRDVRRLTGTVVALRRADLGSPKAAGRMRLLVRRRTAARRLRSTEVLFRSPCNTVMGLRS